MVSECCLRLLMTSIKRFILEEMFRSTCRFRRITELSQFLWACQLSVSRSGPWVLDGRLNLLSSSGLQQSLLQQLPRRRKAFCLSINNLCLRDRRVRQDDRMFVAGRPFGKGASEPQTDVLQLNDPWASAASSGGKPPLPRTSCGE